MNESECFSYSVFFNSCWITNHTTRGKRPRKIEPKREPRKNSGIDFNSFFSKFRCLFIFSLFLVFIQVLNLGALVIRSPFGLSLSMGCAFFFLFLFFFFLYFKLFCHCNLVVFLRCVSERVFDEVYV